MTFPDIRAIARERRRAALAAIGPTATAASAGDVDALLHAAMEGVGIAFMLLRAGNPYGAGVKGLLHRRGRLLRVAESLDEPQRRAVAAHELGHWFLHTDPKLQLTKLNFPTSGEQVEGYSPAELKEVQADVFAAEFLCPVAGLRAHFEAGLRPSEISRRLGIPEGLVRAQAVEALLGEDAPASSRPAGIPDADGARAEAATNQAPHSIVVGAASSGRTTAAAGRVVHLLHSGRSPASIAVIARAQAQDALRRAFAHRADGEGVQVWSGTMQGYCKELLRKYAERAGLAPSFGIVDDVAAIELVTWPGRDARGIAGGDGGTERREAPTAAERAAAAATYREITALKHGASRSTPAASEAAAFAVQRSYDEALQARGKLDAADLAVRALALLESDGEVAARVAALHADIVVDDYDDLTRRQQEVLRALSRHGTRIFATAATGGTVDGFRGADAAGAAGFDEDFPGAARVALPERLDCVAIPAAALRALASLRPCAPRFTSAASASVVATPREEATAIARRVKEWEGSGIPARDQVVLARTHRALERIAGDLRALGVAIAYDGEADGRESFADLLAVAALRHERRGHALARVAALPTYGVDPGEIAAASAFARRSGMTGLEAIRHLSYKPRAHTREGSGFAGGFARLAADLEGLEASSSAAEFVGTWLLERSDHLAHTGRCPRPAEARRAMRQFLGACEEHARQGGLDDADLARRLRRLRSRTQDIGACADPAAPGDAIALMTVHAARGFKFGGVHLAALPPPCARIGKASVEARMFEIAITRARSRLHMTRCLDAAAARWEGRLAYHAMSEDEDLVAAAAGRTGTPSSRR